MDEAQSLTKSSEQEPEPVEDCVDYFNRHEVGEDIYRNKANGDDEGHIEYEEEIEEDARPD